MTAKRFAKRLFCVLFCMVLLFTLAVPPMQVKAIVGVDDVIAAGILVVLASMGIGFTVDQMNGGGVTDALARSINDFCTDVGKGVSDFCDSVFGGMTTEPVVDSRTGIVDSTAVSIAPEAIRAVGEYADWLVDEYDLTSNGESVTLVDGAATAGTLDDVWDFADDEDAYLTEIGSLTGIDSEGGLIWYVSTDDIDWSKVFGLYDGSAYTSVSSSLPYTGVNWEYHFMDTFLMVEPASDAGRAYLCGFHGGFLAPVTGYYYQLRTIMNRWDRYVGPSTGDYLNSSAPGKVYAGYSFTVTNTGNYTPHDTKSAFFYYPVYRITPTTGAIDTVNDTTYGASTRAGSLSNTVLGWMNGSGELVTADATSIVNEDAMTYTNPVTNQTYDMSSWTYDYSDRSYSVTTVEGDTTTITYGDEYTTIQEGDIVYNIYYVMEGDGTLVLDPGVINIPDELDENKDVVIYVGGATGTLSLDQLADLILSKQAANELEVSETAAETQPGGGEQDEKNDDYKSPGLEDVFPFCIPFDIYNFLTVLNAAREAPRFEFPIVIESLGFEYTLVIDLAGFDTVAAILRTMELLLFAVGLAYITRSMMIRS